MGGFLRFQVFARKADDRQFVQALREDLPRRPRRRALQGMLGLGLILAGLLCAFVVPQLLLNHLARTEGDVLTTALTRGIAIGAAAAVLVLSGVRFLGDWSAAAVQDRMARLLVDYHDRLADAAEEGAGGEGAGADEAEDN